MNRDKMIEYRNGLLEEKYYELKHRSGLSVLIFPKDRQSCCSILSCEYGSIDNEFYNDNDKLVKVPDGIAHFLEHKMFENEDGSSVEENFSRLGADSNAFTKWDATAYYFTCNIGEKFYPALDELISFVMSPHFTEESVNKEKDIITQEILMCEDDPYDRCFLNLVGGLYARNPIRIDVAGTVKSISEIDCELLRACHKKFYTPANMTLIVCGTVDVQKVVDSVDKFFTVEKYPSVQPPKRKAVRRETKVYKQHVSAEMALERPMFCIGFKDTANIGTPSVRRKRQILAEILVGLIFSSSAELYCDLYKRGIMTTPFSYGEEYGKSYAFVYAAGECDDPELVFDEIKRHVEKLKLIGISREDFERRKKMTYSSDIKMYDSTWDIASALLDDALAGVELFEDFKLINECTADDANKLLNELFCDSTMTYSTVLPIKKERKS